MIIFDQERFALNPIVMRFAGFDAACPAEINVSLRRVGAYYPASVPKVHKNQDERSTGVASLCEVCLFSRWL
jgi:hypothetical protein